MRALAGDREVDAALDARAPDGDPPRETADRTRRRRLRRAEARARDYLNEMRRGAARD